MDLSRSLITGIMMRGFGTSTKTNTNSDEFIKVMRFSKKEVDIRQLCIQTWRDMNYCPFNKQTILAPNGYHYPVQSYIYRLSQLKNGSYTKLEDVPFGDYKPSDLTIETLEEMLQLLPDGAQDLVFENVQARIRTMILMSHGFVIGTGDMSELALGWCTYNGDHMSMYNPNCSIPKTLVKELIRYYAENSLFFFKDIETDRLKTVLQSIYETVVSPELLPLKDGEIAQSTEDSIGPYELHDFFLYNFIRNSFSFKKIAILAYNDFDGKYSFEEIKKWLKVFIVRFFMAQFKRSCVPDGPKGGSVSLSPRGDWRMPSDADVEEWINELECLQISNSNYDEIYVAGGVALPEKYVNKEFEKAFDEYIGDIKWSAVDEYSKHLARLNVLFLDLVKKANLFKSFEEILHLSTNEKYNYLIELNNCLNIIPLKNPHMDNPR
jgi:NAD+ synthase (glutamine-hydrolysing)